MSLFAQLARVKVARAEMDLARKEFSAPASALLARGQQNPLTTVGAAAGAGFVLGTFNVHPLRVPGLGSLLGGGVAEMVAHGARLIAELGDVGLGDLTAGRKDANGDTQDSDSGQSA